MTKPKPWTYDDDRFLVDYYGVVGDYVGTHDLGREPGAADKRVKFLKESGAWQVIIKRERALTRAHMKAFEAELEYAKLVGWKLKAKDYDEIDEHLCYLGDRPWRDDPECEV